MTVQHGGEGEFERTLATWLAGTAPAQEPPDLLERILGATAVATRRPAWWAPWSRPRFLTGRGRLLVPALGFAAVALATVWLVLALAGAPGPHLPVPLGQPGLLVAAKDGEILLLDPAGRVVNRASTGAMFGAGAWSHDGTRLAHAEGSVEHPDLVITDEHLTEELRIPLPGATLPWFSWSPNDRQIAFGVATDTEAQVYVVDVAVDAKPRAITDIALDALSPSWSPDGALIAMRGGVEPADVAIYVVRPDGTGLTRLSHIARGIDPSCGFPWTPDGRSIVFSTSSGVFTVWRIDRDGGNELELTPGSAQTFCPSISPDGTRIAASVWGPVNRFLTVMRPDGSGIVTPAGPIWDAFPGVWAPDGRTLAMNGRSINGKENPRAFLDPNGIRPARTFLAENAFITDWQRLAP